MDIGSGIAIAGIWIGVGITGLGGSEVAGVAFFAMLATMFVAMASA